MCLPSSAVNILYLVFKQVISRLFFSSESSLDFGITTIHPCVINVGVNSGLAFQQFIAFLSGLHVLVSFFHQKFWIPSIPSADQFFLFFSMCCSFHTSTVISSTCITLSFILLTTVSIHFPFWCFCIVIPYSTPESHESINACNRSFVLFLIDCTSEEVTFVFFKNLIVTYS